MRAVLSLFAIVILASSSGCSSPTELVLVVKADPSLVMDGHIASIVVKAGPITSSAVFFYSKKIDLCADAGSATCRPQKYASDDYDGALTFPIRFLFEPGSQGVGDEIRVWVDAYDSDGVHRLSSAVHFLFSKDHRLWVELPLYAACLGVLVCESADQACGLDAKCVDVPPTTTQPSDDPVPVTSPPDSAVSFDFSQGLSFDFSQGPSFDFSLPVDMALSCGKRMAACCTTGTPCTDASTACDPDKKTCAPCGGKGQICCDGACNDDQLSCQSETMGSSRCLPCGDEGGVCCAGAACRPAKDTCNNGTCEPCGDVNEPCCGTGAKCNAGSTCAQTMEPPLCVACAVSSTDGGPGTNSVCPLGN